MNLKSVVCKVLWNMLYFLRLLCVPWCVCENSYSLISWIKEVHDTENIFWIWRRKKYITFRNVAQLSTKAVGINIPIKHQPAQSWVFICTFVWSCKLLWFCSLEDFAFSSNDNLAVLTLHEVSLYYFFFAVSLTEFIPSNL